MEVLLLKNLLGKNLIKKGKFNMKKIMKNQFSKKLQNGFTLIELMIVVAIIAIIMTFAMPAYRNYVLRSELTEGITAMSTLQVQLEQYFQDNRTYAGACTSGTLAPLPTNLKNFTLSCSNLGTDSYNITATGLGFTYTVDQSNDRSTTSAPPNWPTSNSCWIIDENGTCS
jgi:type IV pilus assembly protein PilE